MIDPDTLLENGWVLAVDGVVEAVGNGRRPAAAREIDHGPGLLMPALVNAHTHLELTALKDKVAADGGFEAWVPRLLKAREAAGNDALAAGVADGVAQLIADGCGLVGDISSLGLSWGPLAASELDGVLFHEPLGSGPAGKPDFQADHDGRLRMSVAGHAPHTTAPGVLRALKADSKRKGRPFSIHLDESGAERIFIAAGKGAWADFLTQRGIAFSDWGLPAGSPVDHVDRLGLLDNRTIAVHLLGAGPEEFDLLKHRGAHVCVCPRSNWRLHRRLPDIEGMMAAGLAPCLGTDSLASAPSLSIFDEMAYIRETYPNIPPNRTAAMATLNGARALGLEHHYGDLHPGKRARFAYDPNNTMRLT
jgi:cytosine/adenosine deaminase-related metal-dependent hydrolase